MKKIDRLIHEASTCPPKLTDEKGFRQVWFTRGEMVKLFNLTVAETIKECADAVKVVGATYETTR